MNCWSSEKALMCTVAPSFLNSLHNARKSKEGAFTIPAITQRLLPGEDTQPAIGEEEARVAQLLPQSHSPPHPSNQPKGLVAPRQ